MFLEQVHNFVKKNKLISRAANSLSSLGVPHVGVIGNIAQQAGYGRRRRRRRKL